MSYDIICETEDTYGDSDLRTSVQTKQCLPPRIHLHVENKLATFCNDPFFFLTKSFRTLQFTMRAYSRNIHGSKIQIKLHYIYIYSFSVSTSTKLPMATLWTCRKGKSPI
jgi:hypothetical protein